MEPGGSEWTEGIRAFQLSGQDPKPSSLGLEPDLLARPLWSPYFLRKGRGFKAV